MCGFDRDFLEQLSSKQETVDEAALDEELRQVRLFEDDSVYSLLQQQMTIAL